MFCDIEELKSQLVDFYGTAMFSGNPMATYDLEIFKQTSDVEIIEEAKSLGFI